MATAAKWDLVCRNNGCQFLREGLTKKKANMEATSHANAYGHDVAMVEAVAPIRTRTNPGVPHRASGGEVQSLYTTASGKRMAVVRLAYGVVHVPVPVGKVTAAQLVKAAKREWRNRH